MADNLTPRWYPLNYVSSYDDLYNGLARFKVVPAGRRSGKTELAKRFMYTGNDRFRGALTYDLAFDDGWYVITAPTHKQAKRIFWKDMKMLCPAWAKVKTLESELTIRLYNGVEITVMGMDSPDRLEGRPLDGIVLDEYGNMKPETWEENVRPALSTLNRPGWAWMIGVPEGRNHYYQKYKRARDSGDPEWSAHTWPSSDVLPKEEIEQARKDMDELTFMQEFEASFVNFTGRAYYSFGEQNLRGLKVDKTEPLNFCFDFNRSPGIACVVQEQTKSWYKERWGIKIPDYVAETFTAVIGEVWIPKNSNTQRVCNKLIEEWSDHPSRIYLYGDATGGAKGSSSVMGSDWDLIEEAIIPAFTARVENCVRKSNPRERVRVNAVNSRSKKADGTIFLLVDPEKAAHVVDDLEGVTVIEGGAGELDKDSDPLLTHISDALGYYIAEEHGIGANQIEVYH